MKCKGSFIFKSIEKVDKGSFTNNQGQVIDYNASYRLKVDEWTEEGKLNEVKFKVPENATDLVNGLRLLKPYQEIELECKIEFYNSMVRVIPIAFKKVDSNNK